VTTKTLIAGNNTFIWPADWGTPLATKLCVDYPINSANMSSGTEIGPWDWNYYCGISPAGSDFAMAPGAWVNIYAMEPFTMDLTGNGNDWYQLLIDNWMIVAGAVGVLVLIMLMKR